MATPRDNVVALTGNPRIDGLTQGSAWQFDGGARVITYSFSLNDNPNGGAWTPAMRLGVTQALAEWSHVANLSFVEVGSGTVYSASRADIAFLLTGNELQNSMAGVVGLGIFPSPAFAQTLLDASNYTRADYASPEGDVALDNYFYGFGAFEAGDLGRTILLHEIGHALGLKHPGDEGGNSRPTFAALGIDNLNSRRYSVMAGGDTAGGVLAGDAGSFASTPMLLDIAAIQQIYGANTGFHAGDDTYAIGATFSSSTIWDAGGTDTLTVSDRIVGGGATLDLREGQFSGSGIATAIAYGTVIENAVGTPGNDTLTGNAVANRLDGGGGDDRMAGGAGNDTYVVDSSRDVIVEAAGKGADTVQSSITWTLGANVENLSLTGSAAINGTGNALNNVLIGNATINVLSGGAGDDQIEGGGSASVSQMTPAPVVPAVHYAFPTTLPATNTFVLAGDTGSYVLNGTTDTTPLSGGGVSLIPRDYTGDGQTDYLTFQYWSNAASPGFFSLDVSTKHMGQNLAVGSYENAERASFASAGHAGLDLGYDGRGANQVFGRFVIDTLDIDSSGAEPMVQRLGLRFEIHAESATAPAVYGALNYNCPDGVQPYGSTDVVPSVSDISAIGDTLSGGAGADVFLYGASDDGMDLITDFSAGDRIRVAGMNFGGLATAGTGDGLVRGQVRLGAASNGQTPLYIGTDAVAGADIAIRLAGTVVPGNLVLAGTDIRFDNAMTGTVSIGGTAVEDQVLRVVDSLDDADGLAARAYTWQASSDGTVWTDVGSGATLSPDDRHVGRNLRVVAAYRDGQGTVGEVLSAATAAVANVNDAPVVVEPLAPQIACSAAAFCYSVPSTAFADIDAGDGLSYSAQRADGRPLPAWLAFDPVTRTFSGTPGADDFGTLALAVRATDVAGASAQLALALAVGRRTELAPPAGSASVDYYVVGADAGEVLRGGAGRDVLDGGAGADTLSGGAGNDIYLIDSALDVINETAAGGSGDTVRAAVGYVLPVNVECLIVVGDGAIDASGNGLANRIYGGTGANVLDGRAGVDSLAGGAGNDTYVVDNSRDVVTELADGGDDLVRGTATYVLPNNVENLALEGRGNLAGSGNGLANRITGNSGNNTLRGLAGNDTMDGGPGNDVLIGGPGDDTYIVDRPPPSADGLVPGDAISESANGGTDSVYAANSYALGAYLEELTLTGAGNTNGRGNGLNNALFGNDGNNMLSGGAGNDTLRGGAGNDTLDGQAGLDSLAGGAGDDVYVVDQFGELAILVEDVDAGTDTIRYTAASAAEAVAIDLGAQPAMENLTLAGSGLYNLAGNERDNALIGNGAANALSGGAGNDTLEGGGGLDTLAGGTGDDVYVADRAAELALLAEEVDAGNDTLRLNYAVSAATAVGLNNGLANIENLTALGAGPFNLTGNDADNVLRGNAANNALTGGSGNDSLIGGGGRDTLTGGNGADVFGIDRIAALTAAIADFSAADGDRLGLGAPYARIFSGGSLNGAAFGSGANMARATTVAMRLFYDTTRGRLFYDPDGAGAGAAVQIASFTAATKPSLAAADFALLAA